MKNILLLSLLAATAIFAGPLTLTAPATNLTLEGGDSLTVSWTSVSGITNVSLEYTLDNGNQWHNLSYSEPASGSKVWLVPYLYSTSTTTRIRVTANNMSNPPMDSTDSLITISAAQPDAYEPNNTPATATPMSFDTPILNALVTRDWKLTPDGPDTGSYLADNDYYSFHADSGSTITLTVMQIDSNYWGWSSRMQLLDSNGASLTGYETRALDYNVTRSSVYYCRVTTDNLCNRYNLTLSSSVTGALTLVAPDSVIACTAGQQVNIQWIGSGNVSHVSIDFSPDNGNTRLPVQGYLPASGSFVWKVPYLYSAAAQARLYVYCPNQANGPSDSSNLFTVTAAPADAYEPNNDRASAFPLVYGTPLTDAVVTLDWKLTANGPDTGSYLFDEDFFSFSADSGNLITLTLPFIDSGYRAEQPILELQDSTGTVLDRRSYGTVNYNIMRTGTYYCRITPNSLCARYSLLLTRQGAGSLQLLSPNGGNAYAGGQKIPIQWKATGAVTTLSAEYTIDGGNHWNQLGNWRYHVTDTLFWTVPYLALATSKAYVRVTAQDFSNSPSDTSDSPFTISIAPPDAYEPNDSLSTATPLTLGSTVRDAMVTSLMLDTMGYSDTLLCVSDTDFYTFVAPAGTLISIGFSTVDSGYYYANPRLELLDAAGNLLDRPYGWTLNYYISRTGTYYCRVYTDGLWARYTLDSRAIALINVDDIPINASNFVLSDSLYTINASSAINNLSVLLKLDTRAGGTLHTGMLPSDTLFDLPDSMTQLKAYSIVASTLIESALKAADISLPFDSDSIGLGDAGDLVAMWLNPATNQWSPVSFTLDAVNHRVVVHTTHFSIYGLFTRTGGVKREVVADLPISYSLSAFPVPANPTVNFAFSTLLKGHVSLNIYSVKGQKVASVVDATMNAGRHASVWNGRSSDNAAVASGVYMAVLNANGKRLQRKVLLTR